MNRIHTICSLINKTSSIVDIGCDHGKVSAYIAKNNLTDKLIVNDVSAPSLQKAKDLLAKIPTDTQIEFVHCDGADLQNAADLYIIAGMGGKEILRILENTNPQNAIIAPQRNIDKVYEGLEKLGYIVETEVYAIQKNKTYPIIRIHKKS